MALAAPAGAATIDVTTTNDELDAVPDSTCSLREAVESAKDNFAVGGCPKGQANKTDVISLGPEQYELDIPTTDDSSNENGDLDYSGGGGDLTIRGANSVDTQIITSLDDRVIQFNGFEQVLTLERLEVSGGFSADNTPSSGGNVLMQQGKLVMKNASSGNSFGEAGGAIALEGGTDGTLKRVTVTGAGAETVGGAVVVRNGGKLTIKKSLFLNNEVDENGDVSGGAIRTFEGKLVVSDSSFIANEAFAGGAGNEADGGAIYASDSMDIKRSLFSGNSSNGTARGAGGAISSLVNGPADISNSTFFDNDAGDSGGAVYSNGEKLAITHSSFLANDAAEGGHVWKGNLAEVTLGNSILATPLIGNSCFASAGKIKSLGYNVFDDDNASCPAKSKDKVVNDVGFDTTVPEDNGGPTETLGLKKSSKAVDLVPVSKCEKLDQRKFDRPKGPRCDAGAVERGAKP